MEVLPPKVVTTITLAPALRDQLDATAATVDRSRSWVCSRAIEEYLARPAAMTTGEYAALIRRDLAGRPALGDPAMTDLLTVTANLASQLVSFAETIGASEGISRDTLQFLSATRTLLHGLSLLGTANVTGTIAERVATLAAAASDALVLGAPQSTGSA